MQTYDLFKINNIYLNAVYIFLRLLLYYNYKSFKNLILLYLLRY